MNELTSADIQAKIDVHRKAVKKSPRDANAHALLGLALLRKLEREAGVSSLKRALELNPKIRGVQAVLAGALFELRRYREAAEYYRIALRFQEAADLHQRLAECLTRLSRAVEAEKSALRALELAPDDIPCRLTYSAVLHGQHRQEEARAVLRELDQQRELSLDERFDLGRLQFHTGDHAAALGQMQRVMAERGEDAEGLLYLARCHRELKQRTQALEVLQRAAQCAPDHCDVLSEMCIELLAADRADEAIAAALRVLQLDPKNEAAHRFLLPTYFSLGRFDDALAMARQLLEHYPSAENNSMLLFILSHVTEDPDLLTREHFAFGERWEQPLVALRKPYTNQPDPDRVLRVGIVSADLHQHAVARFIMPALEALRHSTQVHVYVYYNNTVDDNLTKRIRASVRHWRNIQALSDSEADASIREDEIDILIDLSGHSARNRLELFARKPAPLQASWIGYAGTTGVRAIDYILCDRFMVPGQRYDAQFSEKILKLPIGAPFLPEDNAPEINALPALTNGYITFGSFHRVSKLNAKVIAQWSSLLHAIPNARMVMAGLEPGGDATVTKWFAEAGIARERLDLRQRCGMQAYLNMHHDVDIALCPFPYTGGTTVGHALWMGVPTLTTVGATNPSHAAATFMGHLGLDTFITDSPETYVRLGVFLSENIDAVASLRATMRERYLNSPIGYPGVVAAALELAFRRMWQRWCAGEAAQAMEVTLRDLANLGDADQADSAPQ